MTFSKLESFTDYQSPRDAAIAADRRRRARFWRDARHNTEISPKVVAFAVIVGLIAATLLAGGCGSDPVNTPEGSPACEAAHSTGLYVWIDDTHAATPTDTVCTHDGPPCKKRPSRGGPTPVNNGGDGGER